MKTLVLDQDVIGKEMPSEKFKFHLTFDIDWAPDFAVDEILKKLKTKNIKATFFIRLHAREYSPFSFENYRIFKFIKDSGHEIGYHSEVIDESIIWNEDPEDCLRRDIDLLNTGLGIKIQGVASHGGMTGHNNLDFWKTRKPKEFGLLYEAYDKELEFNLFQEAFYISDSNWTYWKSYLLGNLLEGDRRSPAEHVKSIGQQDLNLIYLLIHPETYYDRHCYE